MSCPTAWRGIPCPLRSPEDLREAVAMPKITYVEFGGREHRVEVPVGISVMRGAVNNNIPGIDADCGLPSSLHRSHFIPTRCLHRSDTLIQATPVADPGSKGSPDAPAQLGPI